jgi:hypothetical protein
VELGLPLSPGVAARRDLTPSAGRRTKRWSAWLLPSFADLVFLICLLVMVKIGGATISGDADPVRHLTVGQAILNSGSFPTEDAFVYTKAAAPTPPHEWLSKVAIAVSSRWAGLAGPVLLAGAFVGLAFAILFRHLRSRGHPALLALGVTLLAAGASSIHWLARPHAFSFAAAAAFGALPSLRFFEAWQVRGLTDLTSVAASRTLEVLYLESLRRAELPDFSAAVSLQHVVLDNLPLTGAGLAGLAAAPALRQLTIVRPAVDPADVDVLRGHPTLQAAWLGLRGRGITEADERLGLDKPHDAPFVAFGAGVMGLPPDGWYGRYRGEGEDRG